MVTVGSSLRCRGILSVLEEIGRKHATTQASEANDRARQRWFDLCEHRKSLWYILLQPVGQLWCAVTILGDEVGERCLSLGQIVGRPDRLQLTPDTLADFGIGRVVYGVAGEVELTALSGCAAKDRPSGSP